MDGRSSPHDICLASHPAAISVMPAGVIPLGFEHFGTGQQEAATACGLVLPGFCRGPAAVPVCNVHDLAAFAFNLRAPRKINKALDSGVISFMIG